MIQGNAVLDVSGAIALLTARSAESSKLDDFLFVKSPTIYWYELGNVCWKHLCFGKWSEKSISSLIQESLEITLIEDFGTHDHILKNAVRYDVNFYDASYLSLAIHLEAVVISLDKKLNAAAKSAGLKTFF